MMLFGLFEAEKEVFAEHRAQNCFSEETGLFYYMKYSHSEFSASSPNE
jgi:hypothetical protein